jgi:DNA primase small subunit
MDMRGTGGRVAAALHEVDPGAVGRGRARGLRRLGPRLIEKLITHIDEVVTMDVHRLIRMPNSLHGKTGLRVTKLSPSELERGVEYVVDKAVVFRRGSLTIRLRERPPVRRVLGEVIDGDVAKLPTYLAVYLLMSGWGELIDR